jgi:hypothetical protein
VTTSFVKRAFSLGSGPPRGLVLASAVAVAAAALVPSLALADKITHPIAVLSGLDKITGRIISFEVATDETVQFGSLQITERACYTRPATETPQTTTFVEVDEVDAANSYKRIFSGWMFASSPGLHGVEHPIYDIWLTGCKGGTEPVAAAPSVAEPEPTPTPAPEPPENTPPRQRRPPAPEGLAGAPPTSTPGPIEVLPPPGALPHPPRRHRAPSQQFYPTGPAPARDPFSDGF